MKFKRTFIGIIDDQICVIFIIFLVAVTDGIYRALFAALVDVCVKPFLSKTGKEGIDCLFLPFFLLFVVKMIHDLRKGCRCFPLSISILKYKILLCLLHWV